MNFAPKKEKLTNYLVEIEKLKEFHNSQNKKIVEYELHEVVRTKKEVNEPLNNFCMYSFHYFTTSTSFNNYTKPKYIIVYADESINNKLNKLYLQINITPHTNPLVIPFSMCDKFELEQNKTMFVIPSDIFFDYSLKRYIYFDTRMVVLSRDEELMKNIYDISIFCEAYNEPNYDTKNLDFRNLDISTIYQSISLHNYLQRYSNNNSIKVDIYDEQIMKGVFVNMKTNIYENNFKSVNFELNYGKYLFTYSKSDIEKYIKTKFTNDSISFFLPFNRFNTETSDDEKIETVNKYKNDYDYRLIVDEELNLESYNNTIYMNLSELKAQNYVNNDIYRYLYYCEKPSVILHFDNIDIISNDDINIYPLSLNFINAAC